MQRKSLPEFRQLLRLRKRTHAQQLLQPMTVASQIQLADFYPFISALFSGKY